MGPGAASMTVQAKAASPASSSLPARRPGYRGEPAGHGLSDTPVAKTATSVASQGERTMSTVTTKDGVQIYFKDWGPKTAQPIVFHHGWPLSSDDWDTQMLFFVGKGYRVVAHDRRGHGRSSQVS